MLSDPRTQRLIAEESVSPEVVAKAEEIIALMPPLHAMGCDEGVIYLYWQRDNHHLDCELDPEVIEWFYSDLSGTRWLIDQEDDLPEKVRAVLPVFRNLSELHPDMESCLQTKGQNVLQHGQSVVAHYQLAVASLQAGCHPEGWRIPKWFDQYDQKIAENLHTDDVALQYLLYHDCGKPRCRVVEEDRVRFPDHAAVSKAVFLEYGGDPVAAELVGHDMVIHTASSDEIAEYCTKWTVRDAMTLLLAALSEVHSNATMFGGIDSNSFKSKFKTIERRGNQICKHYFA